MFQTTNQEYFRIIFTEENLVQFQFHVPETPAAALVEAEVLDLNVESFRLWLQVSSLFSLIIFNSL